MSALLLRLLDKLLKLRVRLEDNQILIATLNFPGNKDEKVEKTVEAESGMAKEGASEGKVDQGGQHAPVERQDSRSKHRPLAKATSGGGPPPPAEKNSPQAPGSKGVGSSSSATAPPTSGGATSPQSATPPTSKQQGKRTERPKTPPAQGGGGAGPK